MVSCNSSSIPSCLYVKEFWGVKPDSEMLPMTWQHLVLWFTATGVFLYVWIGCKNFFPTLSINERLFLWETCLSMVRYKSLMSNFSSFFFFYQQMVMSLRVSELQVLLGYAGRNKHGRKHELLTKALHLLKAGCSPAVQMKIKELYRRRFPIKMVSPVDLALPGVHSASSLPAGLAQLGFDSHGSPSPLLPVSLLGPKHELSLPHLPSTLHPVHPDVKLQRLPFYDVLDELIKPTSLGKFTISVYCV